jgi:carbonic anhydrase
MGLDNLKLPVNPTYKWDGNEDQPEYVNPVTLNNRIIELANASLATSQLIVVNQTRRGAVRAQLKDAQDALLDFEQDLLVQFPAPPNATKSNRLVEVYIRTLATHHNKLDEYRKLRLAVRELEREEMVISTKLDTLKTALASIQTVGDNIQTHLSYVKSERQNGRFA